MTIGLIAALLVTFAMRPSAKAEIQTRPSVIYEIYPRSFQDSDSDGIGDLDGVRGRLDYLLDLGVDTVWLMPVFQSPSEHGYDVSDFKTVQAVYGGQAALARLIQQAHADGLKILLDMPINSTSSQNPWFVESAGQPQSSLRQFYLWSPQPLTWSALPHDSHDMWYENGSQYYFSSFSPFLPDLNWRSDKVFEAVLEVFTYWLKQGVDGFRLDAAKHLIKGPNGEENQPETHAIWRSLTAQLRQLRPQAYFVGEVWDSEVNIASYYGVGDELNAAFDFPMMDAIISSLQKANSQDLFSALKKHIAVLPRADFTSPILGNHDTIRISSQIPPEDHKLAALIQFTLPGTPTLYYGDEIGIENGPMSDDGDLAKRTPMQWQPGDGMGFTAPQTEPWNGFARTPTSVQEQKQDPNSLLNTYRELIHLRNTTPSLQANSLQDPQFLSETTLSYWRKSDSSACVVIINFATSESGPVTVSLPRNIQKKINPIYIFGNADSPPLLTELGLTIGRLAPKSGVVVEL